MDFLGVIFPAILFGMVIYFLIVLPFLDERRRKKMVSSLKRGDRVLTKSGIIGTVLENQKRFIIVEISPGVPVKFQESAIVALIKEE